VHATVSVFDSAPRLVPRLEDDVAQEGERAEGDDVHYVPIGIRCDGLLCIVEHEESAAGDRGRGDGRHDRRAEERTYDRGTKGTGVDGGLGTRRLGVDGCRADRASGGDGHNENGCACRERLLGCHARPAAASTVPALELLPSSARL
jgi:hypothetical protein